MAVEGIRAPIILDTSDIPRSRKMIKSELKKMGKDFRDVKFTLNGRALKELSRDALIPMVKNFRQLEQQAKNAKRRMEELDKVMKKVRGSGQISSASRRQMATMKGVGPKTMDAIKEYRTAHTSLGKDPQDPARVKRYAEAQKQVIKLLNNAYGINKKLYNQSKIRLDYEVKKTSQVVKWEQQRVKENRKLKTEFNKLAHYAKTAKLDDQELLKLGRLRLQLRKRGIKLSNEEMRATKKAAQALRSHERQGAGLMGRGLKGRMLWFAQLRALWGVYRIVSKLHEGFLELDEATARAMRTMVKGTKDYEFVAQKVKATIKSTAAMTGAAYKDVGEALYQLSSAGLSADEALSAVQSTVKMATLTESDMTDTTKVVAGLFNNFRDQIKGATTDTEKFMQITGALTQVWQKNQIDMNEMVQALNQSAQTAQMAGVNFNELAVIMGNMGTRMIRSGRAGRMFRSAVINIAQKSKEVSEMFDIAFDENKPLNFMTVMDAMHNKWKDANKTARVTGQIFSIFGKRGTPALIAMLNSWGKIRKEIGEFKSGLEMAVDLHVKMLQQQQHYKQISKVVWTEFQNWMDEFLNWTNLMKDFMNWMNKKLRLDRVGKQAGQTMAELIDKYKTAGNLQERLVEITAQEKYYWNQLTEVQKGHFWQLKKNLNEAIDVLAPAEKEVAGFNKQIALTPENLAKGYAAANAEVRRIQVETGAAVQSLAEMGQEVGKARDAVVAAKKKMAEEEAYAQEGLGSVSPETKKALEDAVKWYQKILDRYNKLNEQLKKDQLEAAKAMNQQTQDKYGNVPSDYRQYRAEAGKAAMMEGQTGGAKQRLQEMQQIEEIEAAHDEKMRARNMSAKEQEAWEIQAHTAAIDRKLEMIDLELQLLEARKAQEQLAYNEAERLGNDEMMAKHGENIMKITESEGQLHAQRYQYSEERKKAQETYNQHQRKEIKATYESKGAVEAGKQMWSAYGDVIGEYASSAMDSWAQMFAEMGKESKTAWDMYKAIAISQAIIDTYKTAQAGASALAGIPFVGPVLAGIWIATSVAQGMMRVNMIRQQKPQGKAKGGVFEGGFEAYQTGGVTSGVAMGIVGDNPSGKELVIPSEHIKKDSAYGYVRDQDKTSEPPTIVNMVTQGDIARAMSESPEGKNVVVNHIGRDMNERGNIYRNTRDIQAGNK